MYLWLGDKSRMSREAHVRFSERRGGKFPAPTRLTVRAIAYELFLATFSCNFTKKVLCVVLNLFQDPFLCLNLHEWVLKQVQDDNVMFVSDCPE